MRRQAPTGMPRFCYRRLRCPQPEQAWTSTPTPGARVTRRAHETRYRPPLLFFDSCHPMPQRDAVSKSQRPLSSHRRGAFRRTGRSRIRQSREPGRGTVTSGGWIYRLRPMSSRGVSAAGVRSCLGLSSYVRAASVQRSRGHVTPTSPEKLPNLSGRQRSSPGSVLETMCVFAAS